MSNNYFNFNIPTFNENFGEDWADFKTIVDDNVDHFIEKVIQLYWLKAPGKMSVRARELALDCRKITITSTDTEETKKYKLREFSKIYAEKGMEETYIRVGEAVTGLTGVLYSGTGLGSGRIWGLSIWGELSSIWGSDSEADKFNVFFDVLTTDNGELDTIVELLRDKPLLPAFYQIILIDSSWNFLRQV